MSLAAGAILFTFSSCKKGYEIIHNPDGHPSPCQITKFDIQSFYFTPDEYVIGYNAAGNPDSMIDIHPIDNLGNPRYFFRYDSLNRLTDWMITNQPYSTTGGYFAFSWHKYEYVHPNYITDTMITYAGDVRGPRPIASATLTTNTVKAYTLDIHGRISKIWSLREANGPDHAPVLLTTNIYDTNGNLPLTDTSLTYDNKINYYRTNKVWEFIFNNYSRNNIVKKNSTFTPVYNTYWFPTSLENYDPFSVRPFGVINNSLTLDITYACSMDHGPVDY